MELKDYEPKREVYMATSERKERQRWRSGRRSCRILHSHGRDFKNAAVLYDVSYSQVYTWVKKYAADGDAGLTDGRGHHKSDEEVDRLERLRTENLRLRRQLKEQDMLVRTTKKSQKEFEGRVKLGRLRYASKYLTINTSIWNNIGVSIGCVNNSK